MKPTDRWIAVFGIAMLSVVAVAGFALAVYAAWLFHDMPDAADLVNYRPPTSTRVYAWDGTLIGEFSKERRIFVPYDQIPPRLVEAFLAAEDRNFFQHGGIDLTGLGRAMGKDVFNAIRGRRLEGGSTITQQVAKNVLLGNEHSVGRKLKEAILARRLEQTLDKQRILELYLNQIWLGYRSYGVGAAAYNYFGKSLSDLSLSEMAYLGSLPKGPDNYQPVRNKHAAITRRNWVLGQMAESGWITRAEADQASKDDLVVQSAPSRAKYQDADYFVEEVRERALATVGEKLTEGGYYMRTTLDPRLQTIARTSLMQGLENYDHRHGWRGAFATTDLATGWEKAAMSHVAPAERRDWRAAAIVSESPVRVRLAEGGEGALEPADAAWAKAGKGLHHGDLVWVEPSTPGLYHLRQVPQVNGALVAMDPYTGRVLAMVGGYSFSLSNFNRATQAMRQPGSSFKPFVYATALQSGYTPARVVDAGPVSFPGSKPGEVYSPHNYESESYGILPIRRGLELSLNTMTVRIAQNVGMKKIVDNAIKAGIVDHMDPVLAMALGAGETTPLRLTGAYSAFVNGGYKVVPHLIEVVQDQQGKTIFNADQRGCTPCSADYNNGDSPRLDTQGTPLFDPITAYQINLMLQGVVQRGTASAASVIGRPLGGKTGTSQDFRSAWFFGFSPDMVVGVFVGFDDNRSLGDKETGAVAAVPIFINFMQEALKGTPVHDFKAPANVHYAMVNGVREAFQPGTEPHQDVAIPVDDQTPLTADEVPPPPEPDPPGRPPGPTLAPPPRPVDDMKGLY